MPGRSRLTKSVTIRVPVGDLTEVDEWAIAKGVSRSKAIVGFMRVGMGSVAGAPAPATRDDVAALRDQVLALDEAVRHLESRLNRVNSTSQL